MQTFLVAISQKLYPYHLFGLLCFMHCSWLIDSGMDFIFFLCCLIGFPFQDSRPSVFLLISPHMTGRIVLGLPSGKCVHLNCKLNTWILHFFRWQHQDRQHYQIGSWNINHFEIFGFQGPITAFWAVVKYTPWVREVCCLQGLFSKSWNQF